MKLAFKKVEGIGWLALVFLVAILLYPLSLSVATLRSDLTKTGYRIVAVKKDIRYLETEFTARANLRQLEYWNKLEFGYSSPVAAQYLDGERALANLGNSDLRKPVRVAVISSMEDIKPAGIIGSVFASNQISGNPNSDGSADVKAVIVSARVPEVSTNRTTRVASMESKLLDDGLIKDLAVRASGEKKRAFGE